MMIENKMRTFGIGRNIVGKTSAGISGSSSSSEDDAVVVGELGRAARGAGAGVIGVDGTLPSEKAEGVAGVTSPRSCGADADADGSGARDTSASASSAGKGAAPSSATTTDSSLGTGNSSAIDSAVESTPAAAAPRTSDNGSDKNGFIFAISSSSLEGGIVLQIVGGQRC
jgi:hypothetical protein